MLHAPGQLQVERADQWDVHILAHQRNEGFDKCRIGRAHAAGVGRCAGAGNVAAVEHAGDAVGPGDGAINARVAVIEEGFAPPFDPRCHPDIAAGQSEQSAVADLEISQRQAGAAGAEYADAERVDRTGGVGGTIIVARIAGHAAAVEGVVSIRRRLVDRLLQQGQRDAVAFQIGRLGFRIDKARVEIPRAEITAQTRDKAEGILVDVNRAVAGIDEAVPLHDDIRAACGDGDAGHAVGVGSPARESHRAKRVPVGIARNPHRHCAEDRGRRDVAAAFRTVIGAFEIAFDIVAEFVVEQGDGVDAGLLANQRGAEGAVVAHPDRRVIAVTRAQTVPQLKATTGQGRRLKIEVIVADRRLVVVRNLNIELAERAKGVAIVELRIAFKRGADQERGLVVIGGIGPL